MNYQSRHRSEVCPLFVAIVMDNAPIRIIFSRHGTARGAEEWSVQKKNRRTVAADHPGPPSMRPPLTLRRRHSTVSQQLIGSQPRRYPDQVCLPSHPVTRWQAPARQHLARIFNKELPTQAQIAHSDVTCREVGSWERVTTSAEQNKSLTADTVIEGYRMVPPYATRTVSQEFFFFLIYQKS